MMEQRRTDEGRIRECGSCKKDERKQLCRHSSNASTLTVAIEKRQIDDPLTPDGIGPPKKARREHETDCWSPTVLEARPSLSSTDAIQTVPQISTSALLEEKESIVEALSTPRKSLALTSDTARQVPCSDDNEPCTPRDQMIKALLEPPAVKPVPPLRSNGTIQISWSPNALSAQTTSRTSSPSRWSSSVCGWL